MTGRPCSKVACSQEATGTLTYDYADSMAVLGPLSYSSEPHTYDLCDRHADRMSVPQGWQVVRHVVMGSDLRGSDLMGSDLLGSDLLGSDLL